MVKKSKYSSLLACLGLVVSLNAGAELHDRGGGLIYDDVLDITWLQDANYALTLGLSPDGRLAWDDAKQWVAGLEYYDEVRDVVWTGWRLPRLLPINGVTYDDTFSVAGDTDNGYNIRTPNSELGYMFHVNLGNVGYSDVFGNWPLANYGNVNKQPFVNMQSGITLYWFGQEYPSFEGMAWLFVMLTGSQHEGVKEHGFLSWPVRDGDVAATAGAR